MTDNMLNVLSNQHVNSDDFYSALFKINLFLWLHFDVNSVLLFNRTFRSAKQTNIFLVRHKLHLLVPHLHRDAYSFILEFAFNVQRYLESSASLIWDNVFERLHVIIVSRFELAL